MIFQFCEMEVSFTCLQLSNLMYALIYLSIQVFLLWLINRTSWQGISCFILCPFLPSSSKVVSCNLHPKSLCKRGFSISSKRWLLRIGTSGLWSVTISKCGKPFGRHLHFFTAHTTPSISCSISAYLDSVSDRNLDPACVVFHFSCSCCSTNPIPNLLVSVMSLVGFSMLKYESVMLFERVFLDSLKVVSWSTVHRKFLRT